MNLEKANILLAKINGLHKGMQADGRISEIERDLMMSYVRQLYEVYLHPQKEKTSVIVPKPTAFETEVIRKKVEPIQPKETYIPPRVIEIPKEVKAEVSPPPTPKFQPKPVVTAPIYKEPTPSPTKPTSSGIGNNVSAEVKELFREKRAKELSEKLSIAPIRDLTKAIALNDKLLYSNELFGSALVTFNEVIRTLNDMPSKSEGDNYLMELARQHDWTSGGRKEVAKDFIKLVRRRFV